MKDNYLETEFFERIKKDSELFDFIQESSLDGIWYWDLEHPEHKWMSNRLWKTFGIDPATKHHLTSELQAIINQDDSKASLNNFRNHLNEPNFAYDQIVRFHHSNGSVVWIRCRSTVIRDDQGNPIRMLGTHTNISELFRRTETHGDIFWEFHPQTQQLYFSDEIYELLGYEKDELKFDLQTWMTLVHPYDFKIAQKKFQNLLDGRIDRYESEIRVRRKDGHYIWLLDRGQVVYKSKDGNVELVMGNHINITKQKDYQRIFETAGLGIARVSVEGKWLEVNNKLCDMLQYSQEELLALTFQDITHPDDLGEDLHYVQQMLTHEIDAYSMEKRYFKKDGTPFWIKLSVTLVSDSDNNPEYFISIIDDIDEKIKMTSQLNHLNQNLEKEINIATKELWKQLTIAKQRKKHYKTLMENASDAIYLVDLRGRLIDCNTQACVLLGYTKEDILNFDIRDAKSKSLYKHILALVKNNSSKPITFNETLKHKEGHLCEVSINAAKIDLDDQSLIYVSARDITESIELQQKSEYLKTMLRKVLDSSLDGVQYFKALRDKTGKIFDFEFVFSNKIACKIIGKNEKQIVGKRLLETMPGHLNVIKEYGTSLFELYCEVVETGESKTLLFNFDADGIKEWFSNKSVKLNDGFVVTFSVVTELINKTEELHHKEQMLIQQSKMALVGEMIGAIAHQWKQPLNLLCLANGAIEEFMDEPEMFQHYIKTIDEQIAFMSQTINDFRDFFKPSKQMVVFQPCELIQKIKNMFNGNFEKKGVEIILHEHEHFKIKGLPHEFMHVFLNLFNNAKDEILKKKRSDGTVECFVSHDDKFGTIKVRDNAGGIDESLLPNKIFDPYVSTKGEDGTGVGLLIVKMLVENTHKGKIIAQNVEGGAEFTIQLPLINDNAI